MVLIRLNMNKSFTGHRLLALTSLVPPDESLQALRKQFPGLKISFHHAPWGTPNPGKDVSEEEWKEATILWLDHWGPEPERVPKLQYIQVSSAGANLFLDKPLFRDTKIPFCTANGVHGPQISEWIISTFLTFQHNILKYVELQKEGKWRRIDEPVEDAVAQTVGILGYGSIGRQTARVATALGMQVHAYTLHPRSTPESRRDDSYAPPGLGDPDGNLPTKWFSGGTTEEIHEFLGSGLDLLVIALPLTDKTQNLISRPEFEVLSKQKTFIANIARGPIVNTEDLIEALNSETIRGAALDVTDPEPLPDGHPLFSAKNVIITPHVSGQSKSYAARVTEIIRINLERLSQGRELINRVSRRDGY